MFVGWSVLIIQNCKTLKVPHILVDEDFDIFTFQTLNVAPQYFKSTFSEIKNNEKIGRSAGLKVICAGLPRTGTL